MCVRAHSCCSLLQAPASLAMQRVIKWLKTAYPGSVKTQLLPFLVAQCTPEPEARTIIEQCTSAAAIFVYVLLASIVHASSAGAM